METRAGRFFSYYFVVLVFLFLLYVAIARYVSPWIPIVVSCTIIFYFNSYIAFLSTLLVLGAFVSNYRGFDIGGVSFLLLLFTSGVVSYRQILDEDQDVAIQQNEAMNSVMALVNKHENNLLIRKKQLTFVDHYGVVDESKWRKEILKFIESIIEPAIGNELLSCLHDNIYDLIYNITAASKNNKETGFHDEMSPYEYELFVSEQLRKNGWITRMTPNQDQGVDIIAEKSGVKIVVQCKKYSNPVGNKAVQEARTGQEHENADYSAVVTNSSFTKSARQLANSTGVFILHHDQLYAIEHIFNVKKEGSNYILKCEVCNQNLRIPKQIVSSRGRCPKCQTKFYLSYNGDRLISAKFND